MADRDELLTGDEEDGGGAVKSFLDHLEDLRWVLIKSGAAVGVAMLACLFGIKTCMTVLEWPLQQAQKRHVLFLSDDTNQVVTIKLGDATLSSFNAVSNHFGALDLGTNRSVTLQLTPTVVGGTNVLVPQLVTIPDTQNNGGLELIFLDASGPFLTWMHVAFFSGLLIASPFVIYYVGQFVMPALKIKERKYFLRAFWFGTLLFLGGVSFAYFLVMPAAIRFAELFSIQCMGVHMRTLTAPEYISFLVKFMLGMGLGFELPVVLLALVKIGILDYQKLSTMRRYMIIINLVLGAILTTPEVLTQVCMAVALQVLFEISVWIAWYWEREARKKAAIDV